MEELSKLILLFFIYSVLGWVWETVYCSLKARKFVYRGFLIGPYCPIYGFGILGVLYFLEPYQNNLFVLYFFSALLVSVLEYITSYILEKLFHASWWDYKKVPLNINGRVAVPVSLFWGICCVFIVKIIHPKVLLFETFLFKHFGIVLPLILVSLLVADLIYTVTNMSSFHKRIQTWSTAIEDKKQELLTQTETLKEEFSERREALTKEIGVRGQSWLDSFKENQEARKALPKWNFNQRRLLKNYNHLFFKDIENTEELKELIQALHKKNEKK